jgi:para-aminobenzoate synthetase/4-amino-4-deoxychorismate lyase
VTDSPHALAIVDFAEEEGSSPRRLRFAAPIAVRRADTAQDIVPLLHEIDSAARDGHWCVGFVSYDAASAFDPAFGPAAAAALPLAWFAEFDAPAEVEDVANDRHRPAADPLATQPAPRTILPDDAYANALRRIHDYIRAGDVYQVNFTVPFTTSLASDTMTLYERMRDAQGGSYSCYLDTGEVRILSASPELFFSRRGTRVQCRPMKGTAPRGLHGAADVAVRDALLHSEKERAENVMIVDVVRNDLGRIARVGSVHVSALCEPERYPSVWQLTSTVEADVDADVSLADMFAALFPPASVTGAPKIRATAIIRELEVGAREVYCGAVGLVRPGGDATFNVAIRTAWTRPGEATLHLNAGGGITVDSTARAELEEVRTKLGAFTRARLTPALFETMRVERGQFLRLERHLTRLSASADYFDIPFSRRAALDALDRALRSAEHRVVWRARLELSAQGELAATIRPHDDSPAAMPAPVALAAVAVDAHDVRLYHKCVDRRLYESALAAAPGMFDVLLRNADGAVTELTRGNLVAKLEGGRFTPPVECGLLAGTFRAELLERNEILERVLTVDDVRRANRLWFVNSLRGWVPIVLVDGAAPAPVWSAGPGRSGDQSPSGSS